MIDRGRSGVTKGRPDMFQHFDNTCPRYVIFSADSRGEGSKKVRNQQRPVNHYPESDCLTFARNPKASRHMARRVGRVNIEGRDVRCFFFRQIEFLMCAL